MYTPYSRLIVGATVFDCVRLVTRTKDTTATRISSQKPSLTFYTLFGKPTKSIIGFDRNFEEFNLKKELSKVGMSLFVVNCDDVYCDMDVIGYEVTLVGGGESDVQRKCIDVVLMESLKKQFKEASGIEPSVFLSMYHEY